MSSQKHPLVDSLSINFCLSEAAKIRSVNEKVQNKALKEMYERFEVRTIQVCFSSTVL